MAAKGDQGLGGIYSEDFSGGSLESWWTLKTEGTASHAFEGNATANFTMPTDQDYGWWGSGTTYYGFEQDCTDVDFEIEAGFTTWPTEDVGQMGIGIYSTTRPDASILFYDYESGGQIYHAYDGTTTTQLGVTAPTTGIRLRLGWTTSTNTYHAEYSIDGAAWTSGWSSNVEGGAVPTNVVLWAGREGASAEFVAKADYFWETSAPITGGGPVRRVMVIS